VSLQRDTGSATHRVRVLGVRSEVSVSGARDQRIAAVARLQRGRIAYRQLRAIAVTASSIAWLVEKGRLIPSVRCVFLVGHNARVELGRETDALLSVRDGAALSHWSAAALWGLWTPAPNHVDVVVMDHNAARNPGVRVHRSRILEPRDVRIKSGLPVTSSARTLLDIATTATDRQLELAFDRGIVEEAFRPSQAADVLDRAGGHHGRARLAALLHRELLGTTMTRSEGEERMLALMRAARLPEPEVNAAFAGHRIDFFWPAHRFAIEVDGFRFHSTRVRFERDRRKDQDLRRLNIEVMRITRTQLTTDAYAITARTAEQLAQRQPAA
jgi:very-short-patch-repair endonuclease